jgi:hypothetical protein
MVWENEKVVDIQPEKIRTPDVAQTPLSQFPFLDY